jgi:hypothetical protein
MPFISMINRFCISHVEHMYGIIIAHCSSFLQQFQGSEEMETHSSCCNDRAAGGEFDCLHPMPASSFEHSFGSKSFSDNSQSTNGKYYLIRIEVSDLCMIHEYLYV